tara:strand:- start:618 stop:2318 length:1701 start_codon:yes stop_codon:yes gene_type:complete
MNIEFLNILTILGALAFFIFGMKMMSDGIQKAAGGSLKRILGAMTKNNFLGVVSGFMVTTLVQSSSATTVMTVSFVNAGLVTLTQSAGILLGANVGTTVTAWIVDKIGFDVNISAACLPLIALSVPMLFAKRKKIKFYGEFILGFAILFWGLHELQKALPALKNNPEILNFLQAYADGGFISNILFVGVGTLIAVLLQSSSAAMALTITLAAKGIIPFEIAAAMVLGENIGTTITAWLASIPANVHAKRAARIHSLFNIIGVVWMILLISFIIDLPPIIQWVNQNILRDSTDILSPDGRGTGIAIFHSLFNITNVLVLIWFIPWLVKTATKMVKSKGEEDEVFKLGYIGEGLLPSNELSLMEAKKEVKQFAKTTSKMNNLIRNLVKENDSKSFQKIATKIKNFEEVTDRFEEEIAKYLVKIGQGALTENMSLRIQALHKIISNLERVGDIYFRMSLTLEKKRDNKIWFTQSQRNKLYGYFELIDKTFLVVQKHLDNEFKANSIDEAVDLENQNNQLQSKLRVSHIEELENGEYDFKSAMHYRDLFMACEKVGDHLINVSEAMQLKI